MCVRGYSRHSEAVEIVIPEVGGIDTDILLTMKDDILREKLNGVVAIVHPTHADFSQYDSFIFDLSINPFLFPTRSDIEPELGNLTMDVVEDIFPTRELRVHVPNVLPTHSTLNLDLDLILLSEPFFAYIDCPDSEASRARGFVLRSQELQILSFILGIRYPNLID
ncbi:hypothetical protein Tco_1343862 [Tanacetum coccineum]